ncbi:hexosyltransferase [Nephila pilipes]|uniref:Hexosyltransferase n=1 Tax=Nephila pilipes TaxID=299642 RepID=A0A8X6N956_NEPPI|nr:hexosyltransferase [Nephila pilipes]
MLKKKFSVNIFCLLYPQCLSQPRLKLVIIVCSAPQNFSARQEIRSIWGKESRWRKDMKKFFIIRRSSENVTDMFVYMEKVEYGNVIHYNFTDSYLL